MEIPARNGHVNHHHQHHHYANPLNNSHDQDEFIFPLIDGLSGSYVDPSNLLLHDDKSNSAPIGMDNFKSKWNMKNKNVAKSIPHTNKREFLINKWKTAAMKLRLMKDPWYEFKIDSYPVERVIRHRYNPANKEWNKDECFVKMESKQFANGAMRACFRLKKLSNFLHNKSWDHASNYVAKCYKSKDIPRERYFDDVKLQMDAKLWAVLYNKHNPPKKIDIIQMCILEFVDRPGSPLYHLEHYIEGKYIKYNSNAGFVEDTHCRYTPHSFSHFTFERSNHELIVVDIQGVGDLYTDPQIHTANGNDYGDGNLGVKGFALFFYSHVCNDICKSLSLTEFDMAPKEIKDHDKLIETFNKNSKLTVRKGCEEPINSCFPVVYPHSAYRPPRRLLSKINSSDDTDYEVIDEVSEGYLSSSPSPSYAVPILSPVHSAPQSSYSFIVGSPNAFDTEDVFKILNSSVFRKSRPSRVLDERNAILNSDSQYARESVIGVWESILGKVHFEMCKYHEIGRFTNNNDEIDFVSAFFHLEQAANLGLMDAIINVAKIYMQLPHDILPDYKVDDTVENYDKGFEYMIEAAEKGDKNSLYFVAKAYETGLGLSKLK